MWWNNGGHPNSNVHSTTYHALLVISSFLFSFGLALPVVHTDNALTVQITSRFERQIDVFWDRYTGTAGMFVCTLDPQETKDFNTHTGHIFFTKDETGERVASITVDSHVLDYELYAKTSFMGLGNATSKFVTGWRRAGGVGKGGSNKVSVQVRNLCGRDIYMKWTGGLSDGVPGTLISPGASLMDLDMASVDMQDSTAFTHTVSIF